MQTVVYIAQIILAIVVIVLVVMQTQSGGLGSIFGQDTTVYRTRRGLDKTLYRATIIVSALFFIVSILSVRLAA